jgi:hypothetical protein
MALEWAALHQRELAENWRRLHMSEPTQKIAALEYSEASGQPLPIGQAV